MRTTGEATISAPATARSAPPRRRSRVEGPADTAPESPPQPAAAEPAAVAVAAVRMVRVDEGLYALRVGELTGAVSEVGGMVVPVAQVSAPFAEDGNGIEIVASFPRRGSWIERTGGTQILRSPAGGGYVVVTVYADAQAQHTSPTIDLQRLDGPVGAFEQAAGIAAGSAPATAPSFAGTRDVPTEILLHIERAGDRMFPGRGWVGALGRRMRIEAFGIRPLERITPTEIEMKGFLPNGGETPWIPGGALCGTRGRGLPLIGFAVRVAPQRADHFEVRYQGSFFAGGISELRQNGEPCRATIADDPLEAINVRLIERGTASEEPAAAD